MKLRNFLSWFASSLIAFIIMLLLINIVTGLFVDISMQKTLPLIVGSVYDYASPDAQSKTQTTFASLCGGIEQTLTALQPKTECLPENQEMLASICSKLTTLPIEQQLEYKEGCQLIADGSLKKICEQKDNAELSTLLQGCKQLNSNQTTIREFLIGPLANLLLESIESSLNKSANLAQEKATVGESKDVLPVNPNILKYAISYIQGEDKEQYLAVKIISIVLLFILWFVVSHDLSDYLHSVSRMFFATGMLIFATWLVSLLIIVLFTPNTTALLLLISGQENALQPPISQILSLLPVIVLELTSEYVLILGAASICIAFLLYLLRKYYVDAHLVTRPSDAPK